MNVSKITTTFLTIGVSVFSAWAIWPQNESLAMFVLAIPCFLFFIRNLKIILTSKAALIMLVFVFGLIENYLKGDLTASSFFWGFGLLIGCAWVVFDFVRAIIFRLRSEMGCESFTSKRSPFEHDADGINRAHWDVAHPYHQSANAADCDSGLK